MPVCVSVHGKVLCKKVFCTSGGVKLCLLLLLNSSAPIFDQTLGVFVRVLCMDVFFSTISKMCGHHCKNFFKHVFACVSVCIEFIVCEDDANQIFSLKGR